jgi:hypothetical protein
MTLYYIESNDYDDVLVELNPEDTRDLFNDENNNVKQQTGDNSEFYNWLLNHPK